MRDYLETLDWNKQPPAPSLPAEVIEKTAAKYHEAYTRLTGDDAVNWLDFVLLAIVLGSVIMSVRKGFSREIIGLARVARRARAGDVVLRARRVVPDPLCELDRAWPI